MTPTRRTPPVSPWAVPGLYLFALVLIASPALDLLSTVWPLRPGDFSWRYGALGLAAGYLHTPLLGLVLAMAVAYGRGHALVLRAAGGLALLSSAVLVAVMAVFALDVIQMRGVRSPDVQAAVLAGGILQQIKYVGAALVLGILGAASWKTAGLASSGAGASTSPRIVSDASIAPRAEPATTAPTSP